MLNTTDLKNVYFHLSEDCAWSVFPNFAACYPSLYQSHRELLSPGESNSLFQLGIYFWWWNSCFLKLLEGILICFEEELWILTSRFSFSFTLCLWAFFGGIFWICSFYRSFVYDVRNEQRRVRCRGRKILTYFANGCEWFLGKLVFFLC